MFESELRWQAFRLSQSSAAVSFCIVLFLLPVHLLGENLFAKARRYGE